MDFQQFNEFLINNELNGTESKEEVIKNLEKLLFIAEQLDCCDYTEEVLKKYFIESTQVVLDGLISLND